MDSRTKILYGIGSISDSVKTFTFGLFLLFFYSSVMGLPGTWVGVAAAAGLAWDALIDPFIGRASDRTSSSWGRRHLYMLVGSLLVGVSFLAVFHPPAGLSPPWLLAWLVLSSLCVRTSNSLFSVPYHALGAELAQGYHERTSITAVRAICTMTGLIFAALSSFALFFPNTPGGADPKFQPEGYARMALVFGLVMTASGLIATFGTPRRPSLRPLASGGNGLRADLLLALRHRDFVVLAGASATFFLAAVVNASTAIYYLTYYARIHESRSLTLFQSAFYAGALTGTACWLRLARAFDKHRLFFGATLITAAIMLSGYLLVGEGRLFGTGNILPLLAGNAAAGFFGSALWVVPPSMIADVADQDERVSGQRREGTLFGIQSFCLQAAGGIAIFLSGVLVDRFAGLVPGQSAQSPATVQKLGLVFSLLPAILLVGSALLILRYGLTRERLDQLRVELAAQRSAPAPAVAPGPARLEASLTASLLLQPETTLGPASE